MKRCSCGQEFSRPPASAKINEMGHWWECRCKSTVFWPASEPIFVYLCEECESIFEDPLHECLMCGAEGSVRRWSIDNLKAAYGPSILHAKGIKT